ncbi:hypothetical protein F2Q69_00059807 [Brassica cretica]|uniref:Uncharacterized protein n=1 Tax=Brassica cretica TaxID=69181 RepID=A0A8S9RRV5_BRACR|nr:hypothetical protein F2Q69_00059807 [Brassica cretica]
MPNSTRSNKETQLLFSPDPASLERSIPKETRSSPIDNTTCSSIDFCQPPSTQTLVPSTDTRSPLSTKDTHLPSTDIPHPTSIDTSIQTLIDTEPRDMVATLILVRDDRGNLHDQEGHLRNAADVNFISGTGFQGSGNQGGNKNSYGNRGNFNQSSQHQKPYSNHYSNNYINNLGYRSSYYQKPPPPTQESKIEEMLDKVLEGQQRMTMDFNGNIDSVDTNLNTKFDILPRVMEDHLGLQVELSQELFTFVDCSQRNSRGIVRDLEVQIGNALVPLCLTLIDPNAHYNPIPVKKPHTTSKRINDPGIIAACHCGNEYKTEYSESIETHTATIDRHSEPTIDRHQKSVIDRKPQAPIDRRAPITYRVQMPKIDVARLNALRPKPKPSENPPGTIRTPSDDGVDPMEVDRVPKGRNLRKRKEKVAKHLKRGANEKQNVNFRKRVFRIPLDKPFNEAYYTHRLWMFFRETRETEEDIRRMFCEAREKMMMRITLKKKSDPGQFAIPCTVKGIEFPHALNSGGIVRDLEVQIGNALVPVDFHVLDIKLNWNSSLLLGRAFLSKVGAVCNLQTNQLCLTLIDPNAHYDPIPVKKPQTTSRRINDPGIIATCHCGGEYETEYSALIETHTATSIDSAHQISTDTPKEESVDSSPDNWENAYYMPTMATHTMHTEAYDEDYEEERAIEQRATLDEEDRLLHHSSWKRKSPSIDNNGSTSIDTQPQQPIHLRESTDNAYFPSIDINVDATRDVDYSIGSWADNRYHESYAVDTAYRDQGDDELNESFTYEELLNMESRPSIDTKCSQSIDINNITSIDIRPKPKTTVSEKDKSDNQYLTPDEFDILQIANREDNMYIHQRNIPEHQQKEFYDTAGGIDKSFKQRTRHPTQPSIDVDVPTSVDRRPEFGRRAFDLLGTRGFYWKEKDEYGIYRDDQGYARDLDGHTIRVHNRDIRRLLERASRDEPSYTCLPEHASLFTQTELIPEIYTKDEINEMFYGVCGEHKKK